jgi:hypothetical protein
MAVLTAAQLAAMRRTLQSSVAPVPNLDKTAVNAALQACEDHTEAGRATLSAALDTAVAPGTLTAARKKQLFRAYLGEKFGMEA